MKTVNNFGLVYLEKAGVRFGQGYLIEYGALITCTLRNGLQIMGLLDETTADSGGEALVLNMGGPKCALHFILLSQLAHIKSHDQFSASYDALVEILRDLANANDAMILEDMRKIVKEARNEQVPGFRV